VTLAILAHAFLVVAALAEHTRHPPPPELIPLTCNEVSHLLPPWPPDRWAIAPTGCAGRCGGADIRRAPAPATTADKQPGTHEDHELRLEEIGLGLGAVVAGDAETGLWSSVGWWGRLHAGKRTLPRAPGVSPTASHREGCSTQVASRSPTPSHPGPDHSWTESLPACLVRAALRPVRNREAATTGGR
jgi:hypothetical protein